MTKILWLAGCMSLYGCTTAPEYTATQDTACGQEAAEAVASIPDRYPTLRRNRFERALSECMSAGAVARETDD